MFDTVYAIVYSVNMLRAVIDTNVLVAALKSRNGASHEILRLADAGLFKPVVSVPLVTEYEDVLHRTEMGIALLRDQIDAVLDRICQLSINQTVYFLWRPFLPDPKDDMVFEVAMTSQSRYIITFNTGDFVPASQFGIQAITPREFLLEL